MPNIPVFTDVVFLPAFVIFVFDPTLPAFPIALFEFVALVTPLLFMLVAVGVPLILLVLALSLPIFDYEVIGFIFVLFDVGVLDKFLVTSVFGVPVLEFTVLMAETLLFFYTLGVVKIDDFVAYVLF